MRDDYVVRAMTPDDESAVLTLLTDSLAGGPTGERSPAFFRWKHESNPFGRSSALVAEFAGRVVAVRTLMRWEFCAGGYCVRAVRAVDTATAKEHQRRGLLRRLTFAALQDVSGTADLVFNTPNAESLAADLKMGWERTACVPIQVRPVRPIRFLRGIRSVREMAAVTDTDRSTCHLDPVGRVLESVAGLDALLAEVADAEAPSGRLHTRRTRDYLSWRYADAPGLDYRALPLVEQGHLRGLAIGRPRRRGKLRELTLSELLVPTGDTRAARWLLANVRRRGGCDHVAAHFSTESSDAAAARRSGFFRAPGGMVLATRVLADLPLDVRNWANWRLSIGDLEVF